MIYYYQGFKLHANAADHIVTVVEPRSNEALIQVTSLDKAMRWLDAYKRGDNDAIEAMVAHHGTTSSKDDDIANVTFSCPSCRKPLRVHPEALEAMALDLECWDRRLERPESLLDRLLCRLSENLSAL